MSLYEFAPRGRRIAVLRFRRSLFRRCSAVWTTDGLCRNLLHQAATALHQGTEARARAAIEERRELKSCRGAVERQINFCRLGVDAAGVCVLSRCCRLFSDFLDRPAERDRTGPKRSGTRPEERRDPGRSGLTGRKQVLRSLVLMRVQELGLSRIAGADRRRLYAAPVHGLPFPAGAAA